jgi:2-polyprenyl-3-methyl-5-hydroxy-6-metoxy-1,4-benzoquinol methylase
MGAYFHPFCRNGRLLDVGCGNGDHLSRMRGYGWEVAGIEPDPAAARVARDRHGLEVHEGTVEDAPFAARSYDALTCCHVIEHIGAPQAFLRSMVRFLKPGGRLVIVTPNADSLGHRFFGRDFYSLDPPRHLVLFTPRALRRLFGSLPGLRVVSVRTPTHVARKVFKQGRIVRKYGSFRVDRVRLTPLDRLGAVLLSAMESAVAPLWALGEEIELVAETER